MSEHRAGYDVTEVMYLLETTEGATPTTGAWNPISTPTNFDPKPRPTLKGKVGLGRQLPSMFVETKRYGEFTIEHELQAKQADPAFEWMNFYYYILTNATFGNSMSLGKRLKSLTIGAKLDLATDEFWWMIGAKLKGYEIGCKGVDQVITGAITGEALSYYYGETDYVAPTAIRVALPTTAYLKHGDIDIQQKPSGGAYSSIFERVNSWSLGVQRTLVKRGSNASNGKLYKTIQPTDCKLVLKLNMDFSSRTQLEQFINTTQFDALLKIPAGSAGRELELLAGKWTEHSSPAREVDLIDVDLTAEFTDLQITTTA